MTINATQRKAMAAGQTLTAKYKGTQHTVEVVTVEGSKLLYRLADGREFKSPSAAGSAVMDGKTCNGWRFWSLVGDGQPTDEVPAVPTAESPAPKPAAMTARPRCEACGKFFLAAKQLEHHQANADRLCIAS